jgi:hypothetical protein
VPQHPLGQADISEQDYNVYGLAENIHDFRLGTNYTQTFYATDSGNTVDGNVYGQFPFLPRDSLRYKWFDVRAWGLRSQWSVLPCWELLSMNMFLTLYASSWSRMALAQQDCHIPCHWRQLRLVLLERSNRRRHTERPQDHLPIPERMCWATCNANILDVRLPSDEVSMDTSN